MVKGEDFKFDVHVTRDSPGMTPYKISEKGGKARVMWLLKFT